MTCEIVPYQLHIFGVRTCWKTCWHSFYNGGKKGLFPFSIAMNRVHHSAVLEIMRFKLKGGRRGKKKKDRRETSLTGISHQLFCQQIHNNYFNHKQHAHIKDRLMPEHLLSQSLRWGNFYSNIYCRLSCFLEFKSINLPLYRWALPSETFIIIIIN